MTDEKLGSPCTKKPVTVRYMTFDELLVYGRANCGANIHDNMPWSFNINGYPVTHEDNDCYLITTMEGTHKMTRDDVLMIGVKGEIYPCKKDIFAQTYTVEHPAPSPSENAEEWIGNLPDIPLYKRGILHYPPRGLRDIAGLCDAYARQHTTELQAEIARLKTDLDVAHRAAEVMKDSFERENATLRQRLSELVRTLVTAHKELQDYCATNQSEWTKRVRDSVAEEIRRAQEAIKP